MKRVAFFTTAALLGLGLALAQNAKPGSAAANSSNPSAQAQSGSTTSDQGSSKANPRRRRRVDASTMGTTGNTPATQEPTPPGTRPLTGTATDQQPNPSTNPSSPSPAAVLLQVPAARAAATHTPDPGTCMNPAALQTGRGTQPRPGPGCE